MKKDSKTRKNYQNYKLDCLFLKKKPMPYKEFKKIKNYQEEDIF